MKDSSRQKQPCRTGSGTSRRRFLEAGLASAALLAARRIAPASPEQHPRPPARTETVLYRGVNGSPAGNMRHVLAAGRCLESIISEKDVVVIKPNVQWWNQGVPNLSACAALVESIMDRPGGFSGEVVLAENCHRGHSPGITGTSGWTVPFARNSDLQAVSSYAELCRMLKNRYQDRFSVVHWLDVDSGGRRVDGESGEAGYVYCDGTMHAPLLEADNERSGPDLRRVIMTYPVFRTDQGTLVDFRRGLPEQGRDFKFINLAAINHHSTYCGATGAVKNYLGISDISGGADPDAGGKLTDTHHNFHSFAFDKWSPGPRPGMLGKAVGTFLNTVRRADLNIVCAEWVGLASRTEPPATHTRAVLLGFDPVAVDVHAAANFLYPNSGNPLHDPGNRSGPLHQYLRVCAETAGCVLSPDRIQVRSMDLTSGRALTQNSDLRIFGETVIGSSFKTLAKHVYMRYLRQFLP
jgi:hypothetical protein